MSVLLIARIGSWFHWIIVCGKNEYLHMSILVCKWVSLRGWLDRVDDIGAGKDSQTAIQYDYHLIKDWNNKVYHAMALLSWRVGHSRYVNVVASDSLTEFQNNVCLI